MPYIDGLNGNAIVLFTASNFIFEYSKFIEIYFTQIFSHTVKTHIDYDVFDKKISSIYRNCSYTLPISYSDISNKLVSYKSGIHIPIGNCHGDFTLDNLIISQNNIYYLFDFLKTFLDTPLQDYIKLMQDFDHEWCLRKLSNPERSKARIFFKKIKAIPLLNEIKKNYAKEIKLLDLISILRIAPYIKDEITKKWHELALAKVYERIK